MGTAVAVAAADIVVVVVVVVIVGVTEIIFGSYSSWSVLRIILMSYLADVEAVRELFCIFRTVSVSCLILWHDKCVEK